MLARHPRVPPPGTITKGKDARPTAATRVTISLPIDIADYLRARSEELREPVSGFVAETIRWRQKVEIETAMIHGLMEDAERDRQIVGEWDGTLPDLPAQ